ncbi:hypothetical protein KORDIASMS9_03105 [Kordia sp. SMS9]|uniref:hypothetical protein n=1 Tax=Kordia sp. SMS9 TaxID=2282170 RepID=UPI000E100826|nr:hypothetical protein [Kordia sp. SMS9]AXG70858.1 hypothetical protein KORDIASMS9_03105 [Kordia sp. SMS9]
MMLYKASHQTGAFFKNKKIPTLLLGFNFKKKFLSTPKVSKVELFGGGFEDDWFVCG